VVLVELWVWRYTRVTAKRVVDGLYEYAWDRDIVGETAGFGAGILQRPMPGRFSGRLVLCRVGWSWASL